MASKKQELVVEVTTKADQAKRDLAQLDKAAKEIGEKPIEVPIKVDADQAKAQLDTTARAAGGAKNAFANLVGNTAQDLGSLAGPLGSVGVALGQVAEYTADAANEGGGLKSALAGAASMAGPMLALAAAGIAVNKVVGDMQKKSQEAKEANKAFLDSMVEGTGILDSWRDSLEGAGESGDLLNKFFVDTLDKTGDLEKTTTALGRMGATVDDLGKVILGADAGFQKWAASFLQTKGVSAEVAAGLALIVDEEEKLEDVIGRVQTEIFPMIPPEERGNVLAFAEGLEQVNDVVEKLDTEKKAQEFIALARAIPGMTDAVNAAVAAGGSQIDIAGRVAAALRDQKAATDEATEATNAAKRAQDAYLFGIVNLPAETDDVSSSIARMSETLTRNTEATAAGTQSATDKALADLALADAERAVVREATDVINTYQQQGMTSDQAKAAQGRLADQAYVTATAFGYPADAAKRIADQIRGIPQAWKTTVDVDQTGDDPQGYVDSLPDSAYIPVYIQGIYDQKMAAAIADLGPGVIPGTRAVVAAPAGPAAVPLGVGAVAAPAATVAPSRAVSVNVNLSGAIVADTFQLQRVVSRAVRQGVRLNGARRYG